MQISDVIADIVTAARQLLRHWRTLALFVVLFDVMLLASYLFFATREASVWQLLLTTFLALLIMTLFFVWQTMGVSYTPGETPAARLFGRSLRGAWRTAVVTLPVLLLAWGLAYLFARFGGEAAPPAEVAAETIARGTAAAAAASGSSWKTISLTALKYLLFGVGLPLIAIHLWIAATRRGLKETFGRVAGILTRALAPGAVLIYLIGALVFGVVPYFLLFTRTPINQPWVEILLLGVRLALAFFFVLAGWTITLGALSERDARRDTPPAA